MPKLPVLKDWNAEHQPPTVVTAAVRYGCQAPIPFLTRQRPSTPARPTKCIHPAQTEQRVGRSKSRVGHSQQTIFCDKRYALLDTVVICTIPGITKERASTKHLAPFRNSEQQF